MKKALQSIWIIMALLAGPVINARAETAPEGAVDEGKKGEARFAVGLIYVSGMQDVEDYIVDSYAGMDVDYFVIPMGVSFVGGYRFGFGLELLGDVCPVSFVAGGINFFSNRAVQLQVEVAYDGSTVTYAHPDPGIIYPAEEIEPGGLLLSIRAAF